MSSPVSSLRFLPVRDKAGLRQFIRLPHDLYRDDPAWIAPLNMEMHNLLDQRKNPFFEHAEACYWLAFDGERPVGRISAQVDRTAQETQGQGTGHFGMIEAIDDRDVFTGLFAAAEDWLRGKGMTRALGPMNLSTNGEVGLLIDGFDTPPFMMMPHGRPYYRGHLEALGYDKAIDVYAYYMDIRNPYKPAVRRIIEKGEAQDNLVIRPVNMKRFDEEIAIILDIFNDAWSGNWGFVPLSDAEIAHFASDLKLVIRPDWCYIAEMDGAPAAFMLTLPNINEAIADLKGRLFPFGFLKLIWRIKVAGTRSVRVPLMGVKKKFQAGALGAFMSLGLIDITRIPCLKRGVSHAEMSWILEDNLPMRRILEAIEARIYKTYRIYEKPL